MSQEKEIIDQMFEQDLIPVYRFGHYINYRQDEYFKEMVHADDTPSGIIEGCFVAMYGCPLSIFHMGRGNNWKDTLNVGGIRPDALVWCQPIIEDGSCFPSGKWVQMKAKDFMAQCVNHGTHNYNKYDAHQTMKTQCIINAFDIEDAEYIDILEFLEEVEDLKYKIVSNKEIILRVMKFIQSQCGYQVLGEESSKLLANITDLHLAE